MSLFQKLKSLFTSESLPGEDRRAYAEARNLPELLGRLEANVTRNEVVLRQIRAGMSKLEMTERATVASMKRGNIQGRGVRIALQTVNRYRKQLEALEQKADVINKNLNLNINLIGKIEVMQALELRGVQQDVIDQIILDFSENVEKYRDNVTVEKVSDRDTSPVMSEPERRELEALEKEIFGKSEHFNRKNASKETDSIESLAKRELGDLAATGDIERDIQQALDESEKALAEADGSVSDADQDIKQRVAERKAAREAKGKKLEEE